MISIYLDWNVISQMKNGSHNSLTEILSQKERFLIPYSTSHIGDLFSGYKDDPEQDDVINEDLEYLSDLTGNACLINNYEIVRIAFQDPKELFAQRVEEKDLIKNLSIDKLLEPLAENPETRVIVDILVNLLKAAPIDSSLMEALNNPNSAEQINNMFPNLKENPTLEGFFNSIGEMFTRMNESDDYKGLRQSTQRGLGINRDRMFDSEDPYKVIEGLYKKHGLSYNQLPKSDKYAPAWFNEISNEYILLDMHGFQEDKVNVSKGRKETFRNTTEDAFHAAFASTCNFYIINDNRSLRKTEKVFKRLGINTFVLKPDVFIKYYHLYLEPRQLDANFNLFSNVVQMGHYSEVRLESDTIESFYAPFYFFDFFNRLNLIISKDEQLKSLVLSQILPTNKDIIYYFEIETLSLKLYQLFGDDVDNKGKISAEELEQDDWDGRRWEYNNSVFLFVRHNGLYHLINEFEE